MGDKIDIERLISYSDDLVQFLKNEKDMSNLSNCVQQSHGLGSSCRSDHAKLQTCLQGYHNMIETCKQKIEEAANAEVASDADIHLLQRELEEEIQREALLREDLRVITSQIKDLEEHTSFVEDRRQLLDQLQRDQTKTQMKLSMYVSVTNIIPDLNLDSKISGHIVDKEKKAVENFEFDSQEMNTCNAIWKMITR
ncbi:kinetochore protein SPC24 homolog [Bidens hawaiensis]|uniref:kinetochore protein SPC24 homolog n=1 Tax=Bidens hawaiensis TaxID=980011 RepID=UPI00404A88D8